MRGRSGIHPQAQSRVKEKGCTLVKWAQVCLREWKTPAEVCEILGIIPTIMMVWITILLIY
jgi:hypothetical protein